MTIRTIIMSLFLILSLIVPNFAYSMEKQQYMRFASMAPKNVGWAKNIRTILHPALDKYTQGNLAIKWYWGGVLGSDKDYIELMKTGKLDGAAFSAQGVVLACPEFEILELPFMFNSWEEVDYICLQMEDLFDEIAHRNGYQLFFLGDQDFDQVYSTKYPMISMDSFKKANLVTWAGPLEEKLLAIMGAVPLKVDPSNITKSLRHNKIDTYIGPAIWVIGSQMYTVTKYVNPMKIRYSPAATFVTMNFWEKIPQKYKKNLKLLRGNEAVIFRKRCRKDNGLAIKAMLKYGMQLVETPPASLQKMKDKTKRLWYETADTPFKKQILKELLEHLKQFRKQKDF